MNSPSLLAGQFRVRERQEELEQQEIREGETWSWRICRSQVLSLSLSLRLLSVKSHDGWQVGDLLRLLFKLVVVIAAVVGFQAS